MSWKKRLLNVGILSAVFVVAVLFFGYLTNKGNDDMTADMGAATYPQVSFSYDGYSLNTLSGYAKRMDIVSMRDSITPVVNGRLNLSIQGYGNKIESLRYRIFSLNGKEKLLDETVKKPGEEIALEFDQEGLLTEERVLELTLDLGKDQLVHFYTRIKNGTDAHMLECLDYIRNFHESALGKVEGAGVGAAIEPSEEGDNTTFGHVTIHSDYDHVSWGELEPVVEQGERWYIKEMNSSSTSVQLEYRVRCKGEENETDLYTVKEFFRVRHIPEVNKTYLLDYDRTMDQLFDPTKVVLNEKGILLGIQSENIPYEVNKDGSIVSFIVGEELWNYNKNTDEISLVFSFSAAENTDGRNLVAQHQLELLEMDGKGNTTFAVYGYMNRGEHEGETGVAVYCYDIETNSVEEKVFISTDISYGNVIQSLNKLAYYNVDQDTLYVMLEGTLYEYQVSEEEQTVLVKGLDDSQYTISENGHMAAYQKEGDENGAKKLEVLNLDNGKKREVTCQDSEYLKPLGFVKNDFVYGVAKAEDMGKTVFGERTLPMYKVEIQDEKSKVIKTYEVEGIFVLSAEFEDNMITLNRATKNGETYTKTAPDYITNNKEKKESNIYLESYATELKETQRRLTFENGISDKEPKVLKPKQVLFETPSVVTFDESEPKKKYFVYGHGELQGSYGKAGEAVRAADAISGVVVAEDQTYVWERGNRNLQHTISDKDEIIEGIRAKLAAQQPPAEVMKEINGGSYMDLTGCSTEELLYLIGMDRPVVAMLDSVYAVILVGYDDSSVTYVDVASGERRSVPYEEMDQMTAGSGNTYIG